MPPLITALRMTPSCSPAQSYSDKYFDRIAFGSFDAMSWYDSLISPVTLASSHTVPGLNGFL